MRKGDENLTWKGSRVMSWVNINLFVIQKVPRDKQLMGLVSQREGIQKVFM